MNVKQLVDRVNMLLDTPLPDEDILSAIYEIEEKSEFPKEYQRHMIKAVVNRIRGSEGK